MIDAMDRFFAIVQTKKTQLPNTGVLVVDDPNTPFSVTNAEPMAVLAVAETDADIANYQSQNLSRFIDARDNLLYELSGTGYTTRPYYGEEPFFRPMTLCFSPTKSRLYYADNGLRLSVVNVGSSSYAPPIIYNNRINGVTTELTSPVSARRRHTFMYHAGNLYLLGGQQATGPSQELWRYNLASSVWVQLTSAPNTIVDHTAVYHDGYMWVYGGSRPQSGPPLNEFLRYNLATNLWETLTPGPVAVWAHVSAVDALGRLYIHGGNSNGRTTAFYRYTPTNGTWEALTNALPAMTEHTMTRIGNHLYVFGGDDATGYRNELWRFDTTTDTWVKLNPAGTVPTKNRHAAGAYNDRLYIFGGNGGQGTADDDRYNDMWEYNPEDNTWREVLLKFLSGAPTTIPIRQVPAYVMADGVFYFHGGNAIVGGVSEGYSNDFWMIQ